MINNFSKNIYFFSKFSKQSLKSQVRVRYAPSPTGEVHLGGLRTALYNYLFAKRNKGKFILRIEDTDKNREVDGSIQNLLNVMKWANINHDEGPTLEGNQVGEFGPYYQSQRLDIYKQFAQKLIDSGDAYYCFCSAERLKEVRENQQKNKQITQYDKHCLSLSHEEIKQKLKNNEKYVIRLNVSDGETKINDLVHGEIVFDHKQVDDQILIKTDGYPTYHLANVVDDYLMKITHVIRGEEWLTSTPKHVLIYDALNIKPPKFAHLPLLVNPNGKKLSKRQQDQSVDYYIQNKVKSEALINFIGLLGWTPIAHDNIIAEKGTLKTQDELLSLDDMEEMFSLERVRNRNSVVDRKKLLAFNGYYLKTYYHNLYKDEQLFNEFYEAVLIQLKDLKQEIKLTPTQHLVEIFKLILERIQIYTDIQNFSYFWQAPKNFNETQQRKFFKDQVKAQFILRNFVDFLIKQDLEWNKENINKQLSKILFASQTTDGLQLKNEDVFQFLRFLISGDKNGPPAGDICEIIGQKETLKRIQKWIDQ